MFANRHTLEKLSADQLDRYLELGWFRIAQTIFTTNFLTFNNKLYSAIWLRVRLSDYIPERKNQNILKQAEKFRKEIKPLSIGHDHEALYKKYRASISFNASTSLHDLLFATFKHNIYDTYQVNIYDGERLIACGFFDLGSVSAAGIASFYDPEYKKFSLGKLLILLKMEYCKIRGFTFFYPGYFAPGYPLFDYKLKMGEAAIEFHSLDDGTWKNLTLFKDTRIPIDTMSEKLRLLQDLFRAHKIDLELLKYEFFEANLYPELQGEGLFDFPIFLFYNHDEDLQFIDVIVYDIVDEKYHMETCISIWRSNADGSSPDVYSGSLLKEYARLFSCTEATEMVELVINLRKERIQA